MPYEQLSLDGLLERQHAAQQVIFGYDPTDMPLDEAVEFFRWNMLAAIDELCEAMREVGWKPWKANGYGEVSDRFADEIADALLFIANACLVTHTCGAELQEALERAWTKSALRKAQGY
jgi:hypothetical protein